MRAEQSSSAVQPFFVPFRDTKEHLGCRGERAGGNSPELFGDTAGIPNNYVGSSSN